MIPQTMTEQHEHIGRIATLRAITQVYYWPGMQQQIKQYTEKCK